MSVLSPTNLHAQDEPEADTTKIYLTGPYNFSVNPFFSSSLDFSDFADFGDISLQEALIRIPGVQSSRNGEINIRGVGYHAYGVSYNGLRLANTGAGTRNIDPSDISIDVIQSIEVTKVLDPSMDADALAGLVNLNTRRALPAGKKRTVSAMAGGEANTKYISRTGPGSRGWIQYAENFTDELSVSVNVGYHEAINTREELQLGFGAQNFGNGFVDVFEQVSPAVRIDQENRLTASTDVYFNPDEDNSYYFRGFLNSNDRTFISHQDSWITGGDFIDQSTTGADGEQGAFRHEASRNEFKTTQLAFQGGAEHEFDTFIFSYNAGWSQGRSENQDYVFPFQIEGLNYALDLGTKNRPQMTFTNREVQILDDGTVDRQFMIGQNFDRTIQEHVNNQISIRTDVEIPISSGALKAGLSSRWSQKDGDYDESSFEYNRTLRMISFNMLREPNRDIDVIDESYRIPWFVNTENARMFLESQRPLFTGDDNLNAYQSEIQNYSTGEQIYAAYGMGDLQFGDLGVKLGVRVEYSITELEGNQIDFDENGDPGPVQEVTESESLLNLFPNLQLNYGLSESSSVKAAYSKTIDRPDYFPQTPFERIDNQDSTIFRGNQLLEPVMSDNIDLMFEQETGNSGILSIGGFYKSLTNFIEQRLSTNSDGYEEQVYVNSSETASLYGVEIAVEQRLQFLPGFFRNLGVYANYTWSQSSYRSVDNRDKMALTGHSPHVLNGALNYTIERFDAQISYHWSAESLSGIASVQQRAPSLGQGVFYLDRYQDGYEELSAAASYELSDRFRVWANANYLLNSSEIEYIRNRSEYPVSTYQRSGLDLRIGVRFDL
ncbi:TonB-dependent receptor [Gracilimonas sp.]|uniref:TonB-dependent receptor n=1 Tax=Gracilimonas sp. TaxID=1974203 RepID=UPI0032EF56B4